MAGEPSFVCLFCIQARAYEFWFSLLRDGSPFIVVNGREVAVRRSRNESTPGGYLSTVRLPGSNWSRLEGRRYVLCYIPFLYLPSPPSWFDY